MVPHVRDTLKYVNRSKSLNLSMCLMVLFRFLRRYHHGLRQHPYCSKPHAFHLKQMNFFNSTDLQIAQSKYGDLDSNAVIKASSDNYTTNLVLYFDFFILELLLEITKVLVL